jgi:Fe-S-cluster containining protein
VKSGSIDLMWNGQFASMELNCDCLDALPVCHGACCRLRIGYSVELEPDEVDKFEHREHPTRPGVIILASKPDHSSCLYLDDETSLCTIHERRPKMCRRWHCSPGGQLNDKEIERRDAGWMLLPLRKEEQEFLLSRRQDG